jgi:hypothetical protein
MRYFIPGPYLRSKKLSGYIVNINSFHAGFRFISSAAEIIIGVVLFLYPNGLVRFWHSIKRQRFVNKQPNGEEI